MRQFIDSSKGQPSAMFDFLFMFSNYLHFTQLQPGNEQTLQDTNLIPVKINTVAGDQGKN